MVMAKSCPRCRGDLSYVDDVGDSYYSCVQCGHIVYRLGPALVVQAAVEERALPAAVTREEIHRRRIRKGIAARRTTSAA